jgi:hypothetical protein
MEQTASRIGQQSREFREDARALSSVVERVGVEPLTRLHTTLVDAVDSFGQAELHFRKADRREALEVDLDCAAAAREHGQRYQEAGLDLLDTAMEQVDAATAELSELESEDGAAAEELAAKLETELRYRTAGLEVKSSDAREIVDVLTEAVETGRGGSIDRFVDYTREGIDQLYNVRRRRGRGTEGNLSGWCKAALIVAVGVAIVAVVAACAASGGISCAAAIPLAGTGVTTAGKLLRKYC